MKSLPITHVLVDFDGTLINSVESMFQAYITLLKRYNLNGSREEFNTLNGPSICEITKFLKYKYRIETPLQKIFKDYTDIIRKKYIDTKPFEDAHYFLNQLYNKKLKIILVTSCRSELGFPIIKKLNWEKYIHSYVWGEDVQHSKPYPDIYLRALSQADVRKSSAVVIEDSINGVKSGTSAGLKVLGLSIEFSKKELLEAGAFKSFDNLSNVLSFFSRNDYQNL